MAANRVRRLYLAIAILAVLLPLFFLVFGGTDYVTAHYGPVQLWFRPWEGDTTIPDPRVNFELLLHPKNDHASVLAIRVSGEGCENAELRLFPTERIITLPEDTGQIQVVDWYSGDCRLIYSPQKVTGKQIRVNWKFGYQ